MDRLSAMPANRDVILPLGDGEPVGWVLPLWRLFHPRSRGLLQQMADGRLVRPVAMHEQLHDRLTKELIKRQLIGSVEI